MLTHWIVDSGAPRSIRSVSSATFTIVVSRIDMIAPITTTTAILRTSRGSPAAIRPRPRAGSRAPACGARLRSAGARLGRRGRGMSEVAISATTAATALIAKASVKPCSAGKRPSRIRCPASIAAATWAPIEPPIERMIVLMPVATPVWS